jgi:hypothetical protein
MIECIIAAWLLITLVFLAGKWIRFGDGGGFSICIGARWKTRGHARPLWNGQSTLRSRLKSEEEP